MAEDIQKFDPSTLMQGVKDRIKATFVSLIPDEQWEIMVEKEINTFFNLEQTITFSEIKKYPTNGFHQENYSQKVIQQTPFRSLIYEMLYEKSIEVIKKKLKDEWFGNAWPITEENMSEKLKAVVKEAAPVAMLRFFESIVFTSMNNLRNEIQNHRI